MNFRLLKTFLPVLTPIVAEAILFLDERIDFADLDEQKLAKLLSDLIDTRL